MDVTYDLQKAGEIYIRSFLKFLYLFIAEQLEVIALERLNSPHSGIQISRLALVTAAYEVIQLETEHVLRLVHRAETFSEELVVSFQGILCKKDLLPFTEKFGYVQVIVDCES